MTPEKRCRLCAVKKTLEEFHKDPRRPDGRRSECSACRNATPDRLSRQNAKCRANYAIMIALGVPASEAVRFKGCSSVKIAQKFIPGFNSTEDA